MSRKNPGGGTSQPAAGVRAQRSSQTASGIKVTPGSGISQQRAQQTRDVLGKHVAELTGHAVDSALYGGHGHLVGRQGLRGHDMVRSDLDKQGGQYIPQAMGKDGGPAFDDDQRMADDYASADEKADA